MWTLWIVSTVIGLEEPKWTRYAEFEHPETCFHAQLKLEEEFTQGEWTLCEGPNE
jgi:hypothetical protein